jgi:integrase
MDEGCEITYEDRTPARDVSYYTFDIVEQLPTVFSSVALCPQSVSKANTTTNHQDTTVHHPSPVVADRHATTVRTRTGRVAQRYEHSSSGTDTPATSESSISESEHQQDLNPTPDSEDPTVQLFRSGHHIPSLPVVTQMTVSDMLRMLQRQRIAPPPWAVDALALSTRQNHQRLLTIITEIPKDHHDQPLVIALGNFFEARRVARGWTWATMLKNLVSFQGALALLPLYREKVFFGLNLKTDVVWKQLVEASSRKAKTEIPRVPRAMTPALFTATLSAERDPAKACALLLAWFTAQRIGCVLKLRREDVIVNEDTSLTVTFRRGKTATAHGPYSVHTCQLQHHLRRLEPLLNASPHAPLFQMKSSAMLATFRLVSSLMEAKSIRRGSLQQMAKSGTPVDILMRYSGHTREKTLMRYLNWGSITQDISNRMAEAGQALMSHLGQH